MSSTNRGSPEDKRTHDRTAAGRTALFDEFIGRSLRPDRGVNERAATLIRFYRTRTIFAARRSSPLCTLTK